ncbi:RsmD family RNA methyltransferase [Rosistilla oblonga]|uniref:RsmD family RNA methyltransferase n=1 Tax=Rosistilla oblonga TaxID=2527990 RepID=UPI003A9764CF
MKKSKPYQASQAKRGLKSKATTLRVIGGDMRGRKVRYNGDRSTRPMRDSVRESLFNLIGQRIKGSIVFDPFGGTGVLAIESISRGASRAVTMEQNRRTLEQIRQNVADLDLTDRISLTAGDAFRGLGALMHQAHAEEPDTPWVFLMCPPYEMFQSRIKDLNRMICFAAEAHPHGVLVAECDNFFDTAELTAAEWDVRKYGITQLALTELSSVQLP